MVASDEELVVEAKPLVLKGFAEVIDDNGVVKMNTSGKGFEVEIVFCSDAVVDVERTADVGSTVVGDAVDVDVVEDVFSNKIPVVELDGIADVEKSVELDMPTNGTKVLEAEFGSALGDNAEV